MTNEDEIEPAYIMIQCDMGHEIEIISRISDMSDITEVRGTYGTYDIFCRATGTRTDVDRVVDAIRHIPHIRSTTTLRSVMIQGGR